MKYHERIWDLVRMNQKSLIVDFNDLILFNPDLAEKIIDKPGEVLEAFNQALLEVVSRINPEYVKQAKRLYIRLRNPPRIMKIREITSDYIGKLVSIEGIVTRITRVDAKLIKAVYKHVTETGEHEFEYPIEGFFTDKVEKPPICLVCMKPSKLDLAIEKSEFIDWQKIVIQEKPEEVPGGQIPRSIEAVLTGDIVDAARPGDRLVVTGILRVQSLRGSPESTRSRGLYTFYIDVNHVDVQEKVLEDVVITREDEGKILELARDPWIREKIIASIAPGIYGYWDIKEAIALLLFSGSPKILPDGTRIRGDIHVLITGDPGTAKSQLLQFTSRISPRGLYTSGKGSTAAGLTAAVLRDKTTGEYYLEAGALVLADGGVACLHPETRLLVDGEFVEISKLFSESSALKAYSRNGSIEICPLNREVYGVDPDNLSPVRVTATMATRKYWRGRLVELTTESGYRLLLTPDHLLIDGESLEWKQVSEFKPGERVLSILRIPSGSDDIYVFDIIPDDWFVVIDNEETHDLVFKLGEDIDTQLHQYGYMVRVGSLRRILGKTTYMNRLKRNIVKYFNGEKIISPGFSEITPSLGYVIGFIQGCSRVSIDKENRVIRFSIRGIPRDIVERFYEKIREIIDLGGLIREDVDDVTVAGDLHIFLHILSYFSEDGSRRILKLPNNVLRAYIAGLIDTSGLVKVESSSRGNRVEYISVIDINIEDEERARLIPLVLRRFDIYSKIIPRRDGFTVRIERGIDVYRLIDLTRDHSIKIQSLLREIDENSSREIYIERSKSGGLEEPVIHGDYYLDRVVGVKYIDYDGYVYDLYVPGIHNFLAEGIIVHNCIDEIDKMREEDRSAIHEALEQQTVSIAKAGIVARLNARTSVLAAGNPKHGRYDSMLPVSKNIDLPPTILSRFDLLFVVQDIPHAERDRKLARHILGIHTETEKARGFIDLQLLKKYISYARRYIRPQLTPESAKLIEEFYVNLRQASLTADDKGPSAIAITPRQLEALIRLTEAHARMALKTKATIEDAEEAIRLMITTLSRVGIDIESGRLDIDVLETGISATRREKKKKFTEFLFKLLDEVGEIELNELYNRARENGFEKDFVSEAVNELIDEGEIYMAGAGKISKTKIKK